MEVGTLAGALDKLREPVTTDGPTGFENQFRVRLDGTNWAAHSCMQCECDTDNSHFVSMGSSGSHATSLNCPKMLTDDAHAYAFSQMSQSNARIC